MSFEQEMTRQIQESTAKKIKRQINYYLRALQGRHKRLLGTLSGIPITPELAEADTTLAWMEKHEHFPEGLKQQIRDIRAEIIEPYEDTYFDGLIAVDDILYGKQRPTQREVIDVSNKEDEFEKALEGEEDE